jgi:hypothetical protein
MTTPCVWPANYRNSCQRPASLGRTCPQHVTAVRSHAGHAGLRLARVHPASLGPQGSVLLPLEGGLQFDRTVSGGTASSLADVRCGEDLALAFGSVLTPGEPYDKCIEDRKHDEPDGEPGGELVELIDDEGEQ